MVETVSTMLKLGTIAPPFELLDVKTEKKISLKTYQSSIATVIMFICNHCPYVKHIQKKLIDVSNHYQKKGISFIAINANDIQKYPSDSPDNMRLEAEKFNYPFPYLFDETQEIARAYQAACTPDFYIFDKGLKCVYRGRFDDSNPTNNLPVTGKDLSYALDCLIAGKPIDSNQYPSLGCNIKWKT